MALAIPLVFVAEGALAAAASAIAAGLTLIGVLKTGEYLYEVKTAEAKKEAEKKGAKQAEPEIDPDEYDNRGDGGGPDGGDHDPKRPRWYKGSDKKKNGDFLQGDRAGQRAHGGGEQYKRFDHRGRRIGTYNGDGVRIRD